MGKIYHRPLLAVDYGTVETVGAGVVLGDNSDSTFKRYGTDSGSVLVFPDWNSDTAGVPAGRSILAVRAGHRLRNTGLLGLWNGWVATYLRISGERQQSTKVYKQDGYQDAAREQLGEPLYFTGLASWPDEMITSMSTDSGAATGEIGPDNDNFWCVCSESFILVVYEEPVPVPSVPYPANGQTISTSSVDFSAQIPAVQTEQPVRAVFQVARNNAFTEDLRTFVGGLNKDTGGTSRSQYDSVVAKDSFTDLGPGTWFLRVKGRDFRGPEHESAWGATTSFIISHGALPTPTLVTPQPGSTISTPYGVRAAQFTTTPSGERKVGVTWQFSKASDFGSGVVSWVNRQDGIFSASVGAPGVISYDAEPVAIAAGLDSGRVSLEDPSQYLSQGHWYARVRATDVYGQSGSWSGSYEFDVSHPPIVADPIPALGVSFDQSNAPVRWRFTDPWLNDAQTAYRMRVYDLSDNLLQDTGKITSTLSRATMDIPLGTWHRQSLKYSLLVWDLDDVQSTSPVFSNFRLSTSPVITCPFPASDEAIVSGQPSISWSSVFAAGGITQKSFRVRYVRLDTGATEFDSGTIVGAATTYMPPRAILRNLTAYQLQLTVTDSEDLSATLLRNFSTDFIHPSGVTAVADSGTYPESGYVEVFYAGTPDPAFEEWRIYRRAEGTTEWVFAGTVVDQNVTYFRDWLVAGTGNFEYTVTQAANRFGSIVESLPSDTPDSIYILSDSYWFIVEDDETQNVRLHSVSGDRFTPQRESSQYFIIGGGRRRVVGSSRGKEGALNVEVRHRAGITASEQIRILERLNEESRSVIMRDPFGNLTRVSLGEIDTERMPGVGNSEFANLNIPYFEVM